MSHSALASSKPNINVKSSETELLEKIRIAETESSARIELAKKEAEAIIAKAREQASAILRQAEDNARMERERILSEGKKSIDAEVGKIREETSQEVVTLKQKTEDPKSLKQLVLSILEK